MRFTADRASLADAVKWVTGAIDTKRASSPAMAGIYINAIEREGLLLTGHDFDKVHTARIHEAEVTDPGTAVPVALMVRDLLGALKGETVEVSADDKRLTLKAGRSSYGVNTFPPGTWPQFPAHDLEDRGTVDADELRRCLAAVGPAADDANPVTVLRGVRLEADADGLSVVGVRSTNLTVAPASWEGDAFAAQLPHSTTVEAARGLSGEVTVSSSDGALGLADASRSVILRVYDAGNFPDWRKFMVEASAHVEVEAELLRDACKRVALTCIAGNEPVVIAIKGNEITVSGSGDSAKGSEVVDCTGDIEHTALWSPSVLLPILATLPPTPVLLSFEQPGQPMALTDKAGSFHHVLMPRRAQS